MDKVERYARGEDEVWGSKHATSIEGPCGEAIHAKRKRTHVFHMGTGSSTSKGKLALKLAAQLAAEQRVQEQRVQEHGEYQRFRVRMHRSCAGLQAKANRQGAAEAFRLPEESMGEEVRQTIRERAQGRCSGARPAHRCPLACRTDRISRSGHVRLQADAARRSVRLA